MSEIVKASGFQELTRERMESSDGFIVLNSMLRFLFDKITSNGEGVDITMGYGTPESNVTKQVGSIFLRLDGGANTSFYVKESGTGNTGWIAK